jgi:hypothetical protein
MAREGAQARWFNSCIYKECLDPESALSMKDKARGFAIRKDRRDLERLRRLLASLFKVALL